MTGNPFKHDKNVSATAKLFAGIVDHSQDTDTLSRQEKEEARAGHMALHDDHTSLRYVLREYDPDYDAVPIRSPYEVARADAKPEVRKAAPRGPRPQNTLFASHPSSPNPPIPPMPRGGAPLLSQSTANGTIPPVKRPFRADRKSHSQSKMSKRRCTGTSNSTQVVDMTDEIDELTESPEGLIRQDDNGLKKTDTFADSVRKVMPRIYSGVSPDISEFTRVEKCLSSNEYAKYKVVVDQMPATNAKPRKNGSYEGTARSSQSAKQTPSISPHWPSVSWGKNKVRDEFIDTNGRRRGSGSSEDPLAAERPSDNYRSVERAVSPSKSLSEAFIISDSQEDLHDMEFERDIKRSVLKNTAKSTTKAAARKSHKSSFDGSIIHIQRIISDTFTEIHKPSQMIFRSTGAIAVFEISEAGVTEYVQPADLTVPLHRINTVQWSTESRIVQARCSRTTERDPTIVIDFLNNRDLHVFIGVIEEYPQIQMINPERAQQLDKIFVNRLKNLGKDWARPSMTDATQEVDLLKNRRKRSNVNRSDHNQFERTNQPEIEKRHTSLIKRLTLKGSNKAKSNINSREDELMYDGKNLQKVECFGHAVQDRREGKNDEAGENPVKKTTRRSLSKSEKQSLHGFVVPDEPPRQPGYSITHGLGEAWKKPMIYPPEGKKKSTVEWSDLEKLDEGEYLNDNLLGFYLRYLEDQLQKAKPEVAKTVYWFNTYFFTSLTQNVRGKGKINYDAVRKWTRSADIFSFDYLVVPINENHHWYLALICNLPALQRSPTALTDGDDDDILDKADPMELDEVEEPTLQHAQELTSEISPEDGDEPPRREADPNEQLARESFAEMQLDEAKKESLAHVAIDAKVPQAAIEDGSSTISPTEVLEILQTEEAKGKAAIEVIGKKIEANLKPSKGKRKPKYDANVPIIMTLDSLGLSHPATIKILKTYLQEEAKDKRGGMTWDDKAIRGMTAQEIPHQQNYWDCGLYVLGYASKFQANPREFMVKMCSREYDEVADWPNLKPSTMRASTRDLIFSLHRKQHPKFYQKVDTQLKISVHDSITQQLMQNPTSSRVAETDLLSQPEADNPSEVDPNKHSREIVKVSPEPKPSPKVQKGEAVSQAISIDDSGIEITETGPAKKPKEDTFMNIPGAFTDDANEDDELAITIPNSQEE